MHAILISSLISILPLTLQDPTLQEVAEPAQEPEAKPHLQDGPEESRPIARKGKKRPASVMPMLKLAPKNRHGIWLDEKGDASLLLAGLALLAMAREGSTMRSGPGKQEVRQGALALKDRKPGKDIGFEEIDEEVLTALALSIHARMASYRILKRYVVRSMDLALAIERIGLVFPEDGFGSPSNDGTRLLYFLLCRQIQISKRGGVAKVSLATPTSKLDTKLMRSWLDRCLKDTNADAERLLIVFLGRLVLDPPKDPPLVARSTGFLWKRAHRIMQADQKKMGGELPPRLLFLDTLLRTEFLNKALPNALRESRKAWLEKWENQLRARVAKEKGLTRDDLYRLMTLAQLRGSAKIYH